MFKFLAAVPGLAFLAKDKSAEVRNKEIVYLNTAPTSHATCETLEELLGKVQAFVESNPGCTVLSADNATTRTIGFSAFIQRDGVETAIYETISLIGLAKTGTSLSATMRDSFFKVEDNDDPGAGRRKLAWELTRGQKFV